MKRFYYQIYSGDLYQTALGKQYLKALEEHFGWLGDAVKETRTPQGIDPAFAIAIFGFGILGTSALYALDANLKIIPCILRYSGTLPSVVTFAALTAIKRPVPGKSLSSRNFLV